MKLAAQDIVENILSVVRLRSPVSTGYHILSANVHHDYWEALRFDGVSSEGQRLMARLHGDPALASPLQLLTIAAANGEFRASAFGVL